MHPVARLSFARWYLVAPLLLLPLALLPWSDVPSASDAGGIFFLVQIAAHAAVMAAAVKLGRGKPMRTFGQTLLFAPFAIVGNTALAIFVVSNGYARMEAAGQEVGCGMAGILVFVAPFITLMGFVAGAFTLAVAVWAANHVRNSSAG